VNLKTDDVIYTFTDGYADQFGGPKGKKFKYTQLKELLSINSAFKSLQEQEANC
jgi:serine phosphatase RsbU (regulator of sigma subunit)